MRQKNDSEFWRRESRREKRAPGWFILLILFWQFRASLIGDTLKGTMVMRRFRTASRVSVSHKLGLALMVAAVSAHASGGTCAASEITYFSCQTASGKSIEVCATGKDALQYRFGRAGKIGFQFPSEPAQARASMRLTAYRRYQADRTELTFSNLGTEYALFDYNDNGTQRAGGRVTLPSQREQEIVCAGAVVSRLTKLEGVLRCDPDNALSMGVCR